MRRAARRCLRVVIAMAFRAASAEAAIGARARNASLPIFDFRYHIRL